MRFAHETKKPHAPWSIVRSIAVLGLALCAGCTSVDPGGRFSRLGGEYPARPQEARVEVFETGLPAMPFTEISRLDVHLEQTFFVQPQLKDALPELLHQARLSGAEAVVNVQQRHSIINETRILHVTATGVKYNSTP